MKANKRTLMIAGVFALTSATLHLQAGTMAHWIKGSTVKHYQKPGAPVDITYQTEAVDPGEVSHIDITLHSSVHNGSMHVKIVPDDQLSPVGKFTSKVEIPLDGSGRYPIRFALTSNVEGTHHVRVFIDMGKRGFRAYSIPVRFGKGGVKLKKMPLHKTSDGKKVIIFHAKETIRKD
ncbi:hypothetical protein [Nitratifractor sp.]